MTKRADKLADFIKAGTVTLATAVTTCAECEFFAEFNGRAVSKARYIVNGQPACGAHVLRVAEGRDVRWNPTTCRYEAAPASKTSEPKPHKVTAAERKLREKIARPCVQHKHFPKACAVHSGTYESNGRCDYANYWERKFADPNYVYGRK